MNRFNINEVISESLNAIIQKGENKETNEKVIIKLLKKRFFNWEECLQIEEIRIARICQHQYMLQLKEIVRLKKKDEMVLIYEDIETSLSNYLRTYKEKRVFISEQNIKIIIYQLLSVLQAIHCKGSIHRDIQPDNIFLTEYGDIKLGNFEYSRSKSKQMTDYVGNRWYRSPEQMLKQSQYSQKIDVFSVGCLMAEMYANRNIFSSTDSLDHIQKMFKILGKVYIKDWQGVEQLVQNLKLNQTDIIEYDNNQELKFGVLQQQFKPGKVSSEGFDLLTKMLTVSPNQRQDCDELLKHSFFSKLDPKCVDMQDFQDKLNKRFNIKEQILFDHKNTQMAKQKIQKLQQGFSQNKYSNKISR